MSHLNPISRCFFLATLVCSTSVFPTSLNAQTFQESQSIPVELKPNLSPLNSYAIEAVVTYTPIKLFSSLAMRNPIRFSIKCDNVTLTEDSMFFRDKLLNQTFTKKLIAENILATCPSGSVTINLENPGVGLTLGTTGINYSINDRGMTTGGLIENLRAELPAKKRELVKVHSLMSSVAGSANSLFCLIQAYESDPLMAGLILELKGQYSNLYGSYEQAQLTCPADSVLAESVKECEADKSSMSLFCVIYSKYSGVRFWYSKALLDLNEREQALTADDERLRAEIDLLKSDVSNSTVASFMQTE